MSRARTASMLVLVSSVLAACAAGGSPPAGERTVSPGPATRSSQARLSALLPAAAADWSTYHHDTSRAGADPSGPSPGRTRLLWSARLDGAVYAEPLVVGAQVLVATENDSLYAFAAADGRERWHARLGRPVAGDALPCGNIDPSGITGTPVIDIRAGLVYTVAFIRPARHVLFAVELASGRVRFSRPIDPPGANPAVHQQRGALARSHGRIYVPYGGLYGDCGNYHGWVVGASASTGGGPTVAYKVPAHREAGIWAPSGPAVDRAGNLYVTTGNGDGSRFDFGNSVIRLSPKLRRSGYFAPRNAATLNGSDTDLGSVGPLLLPGRRLFVIGKDGVGYLTRTARLGGIGGQLAKRSLCDAAFGGLAFARGTIYIPCTSGVVAARLAGSRVRPVWRGPGFSAGPPIVAGSAVWTIDTDAGDLYALDQQSGRVRFRASIGSVEHFATPAAGGGRIYVGAARRLLSFGT